ncbi:MAG TPA: cupredoxin family copper-binding protein [Steroidobacteraceae bacterium]|jgi:plastocyanin|nr:cupredoxin family copper-binding protein [Steroidobacteraceae bacterium]
MQMPMCRLLLSTASLAVLLWGATPGSSMAGAPDAATIVLARDFMFAPTSMTVAAGSTVTWTNKDDEPHTVVSDTGLFRSGAMDTNESFSFKFDKPGTYHYACSIHPRMVGTIVVQ